MIVPFPPPEGELTTKSVPLEVMLLTGVASCSSLTLLDILNLLAEFLDFCFYCQSRFLDNQVRRFRQRRISFAIEFLEKKIKHLSSLTRRIECLLKLRKMTAQPDHLLTHITAIGEIGDFLGQSHRIYLDDLTPAIE